MIVHYYTSTGIEREEAKRMAGKYEEAWLEEYEELASEK
jgi:hypothetical protein